MSVRILTSGDDLTRYSAWVRSHPQGSLWQSVEWKDFQESLGRQVRIYVEEEGDHIAASALVVIDRTTFGLQTWEIPRGPLVREKRKEKREKLLEKVMEDAKSEYGLTIFLSPPDSLSTFHFPLSSRTVHPEATRIIDLSLSDDQLLAAMKPKGRYNIGLAQKHGVHVALSGDVHAYAELANQTARRDGFRGHAEAFYAHFLHDMPGSFLLLAEHQKKPIAGLLGVVWNGKGIYYYGASGNAHRELMAPYLLQWQAMRHCREQGCTTYDLFGIAPAPTTSTSSHPWSGVSEFKAKFGGTVINYPPEQEVTLRPVMKGLLGFKRRILG